MFKKLSITCDEASTISDKIQYKEATVFEKIKLSLHLIICKICSLYTKQNRKMTALFEMKSVKSKKNIKCLSNSHKEFLKAKLDKVKF